jgi:hypothetical protein
MEVNEARRLRELERENGELKKLVADLSLDREALKTVIRKNVWSAAGLQEQTRIEEGLRKCIRPVLWARSALATMSNARAFGLITGTVWNDRFFCQAANAPVDRSFILLCFAKPRCDRIRKLASA